MDLHAAGDFAKAELRRFDVTERERILADWLVDLSLARGRAAVRVPRLANLEALTGFDKAALSRALARLKRFRILHATETPEGTIYRILPDSIAWQVTPRIDRAQAQAAVAYLETLNAEDQLYLIAPDLTLKDALAEANLDAAASVQVSQNEALSIRQHPPKNADRCQIDNAPLEPSAPTDNNLADFPLRLLELKKFNSLRAFKLLNSQEGSTEGRPAVVDSTTPANRAESERLALCKELFGENCLVNWGGLWRKRIRANPRKVDRVLAAISLDIREGKPIANPGGYANDLWNRFAE